MNFIYRCFAFLFLLITVGLLSNAGEHVVFLDQTKALPGGLEWNREVNAQNESVIAIKLTAKDGGKFSVILLTDDDYQIVMGKKAEPPNFRPKPLINIDAKDIFERNIPLEKGTYWFIIENQEEKEKELRLVCAQVR